MLILNFINNISSQNGVRHLILVPNFILLQIIIMENGH